MPLPQAYYHVYHVHSPQAAPPVNDWQEGVYWQTYAEWQRRRQVYAL